MGKGSKQPTQTYSQVSQSNLPEYARPYFERLMSRSEAETNQPYTSYPGARIQGFTPDTQSAFQGYRNLAAYGNPTVDQAVGVVGRGANVAAQGLNPMMRGIGSVSQGMSAARMGMRPIAEGRNLVSEGAARAMQAGDYSPLYARTGQWSGRAAERYMNPYVQNVLDTQKRRAAERYAEQAGQLDSAAQKAGAFGGSRQGIQSFLAQREMNQQLNDMEAQGLSQAYQNAQQMFTSDQGRQLQAALANQGVDLQSAQLGLQAGQAGIGAGQAMGQLGSQYGQLAQTMGGLGSQYGQLGAGMGQLGGTLGQLGGTMGQLGGTQQQLYMDRLKSLMGVGTAQQELAQRGLDIGYQDFINQRDYERNNLAFLSGILRGVPVSPQSEVITTSPGPNPLSQMLGAGLAGQQLANMGRG